MSTATGLKIEVQGAAVAVTQCCGADAVRRSAIHEAVVWLTVRSPPACTQGAPSPPLIGDHAGGACGSGPWERSAAASAGAPRSAAEAVAASVIALRAAHAVTRLRMRSAWAAANGAMVSPFEIERAPPVTCSVAVRRPAVSSTNAVVGSATRKLLW
ncbi:MAG: hypothetical protein IPG46_13450 [Actinobacteria bacterium]|nr:hypothetical protein [Actinomycetota bacterium]